MSIKKYRKICKHCGNSFITTVDIKNWCSKYCRGRIKMSFTKECFVCKKEFTAQTKGHKYCSLVCASKVYREKTNRCVKNGIKLPTGSVGAMSEMYVAGYLLEHGYSVFRAMSPSCYCDLIAKKNGKTLEVEVRTGYMSTDNKLNFPTILRESADTYGVWERNSHEVFFLDKDKKEVKI